MRLSSVLSVVVSLLCAFAVSNTANAQTSEQYTFIMDEELYIYHPLPIDFGTDTYEISVTGADPSNLALGAIFNTDQSLTIDFANFPVTLTAADLAGGDLYFLYWNPKLQAGSTVPPDTVYTLVFTANCLTCVPSPPSPGSISDVVTDSFSIIDFIIPNSLLQGLAYFCFLGGSGWLLVKRGIRVLR